MPNIHEEPHDLNRSIQPMPEDIRERLVTAGLLDRYYERPPYQQNDYLGWIARAAQRETREKRVAQMVDELTRGGVYMNMAHPSSRRE